MGERRRWLRRQAHSDEGRAAPTDLLAEDREVIEAASAYVLELDSAVTSFAGAGNDAKDSSAEVRRLTGLAERMEREGHPDAALVGYHEAVVACREGGDSTLERETVARLGALYERLNRPVPGWMATHGASETTADAAPSPIDEAGIALLIQRIDQYLWHLAAMSDEAWKRFAAGFSARRSTRPGGADYLAWWKEAYADTVPAAILYRGGSASPSFFALSGKVDIALEALVAKATATDMPGEWTGLLSGSVRAYLLPERLSPEAVTVLYGPFSLELLRDAAAERWHERTKAAEVLNGLGRDLEKGSPR